MTKAAAAPIRMLDELLLPLKLIIPQPIIAKIPFLSTNEEIRTWRALEKVEGRLLDIGCGENRLVRAYRAQGGDGLGVDAYPWEGVDHVAEDSSRLPFEDGSFDTVTFVASLNHIPNREAVLREAHRLLSAQGRLVLTNLTPLLSRVWHAYAFWDRDQHERGMAEGEVWGFTPEALARMLEQSGFRIVDEEPFSWRLNRLYVCEPVGSPRAP